MLAAVIVAQAEHRRTCMSPFVSRHTGPWSGEGHLMGELIHFTPFVVSPGICVCQWFNRSDCDLWLAIDGTPRKLEPRVPEEITS